MADVDRKLASVRRIAAIDPIEGADQIICVTVDGWKLVSAKSNGFQVGDLVIYFEIDSFLPIRPEFEWMRERCYKNVPGLGEGFRVRTIKLRGQVSQGLVVPMSDFLECISDFSDKWYYIPDHHFPDLAYYVDEGDDLTEFLGVKKYEKPISAALAGKVRGNFPSFLRKTDEERAQNCWGGIKKWIFYGKPLVEEITEYADILVLEAGHFANDDLCSFFKSGDMWFRRTAVLNSPEVQAERKKFEATLKLDGSSLTVYHNDGQYGVCSRNQDLKRDPNNAFWKAVLKTKLIGHLAQTGQNLAIQGELMGPGVQGNRENLGEVEFYVFNIFDIDQQRYYTPTERRDWLNDLDFGIRHTPVLNWSIAFNGDEDIDYFIEIADNTKSMTNAIAEGIVFKSHCPDGPSFKIVSNKFLLKEKD